MNKTIEYQDLISMEPVTLEGEYKTRTVWLNNRQLDPENSLKIYNHCEDGFDWGHSGDGSAQLALAILFELIQNKRISMILHHIFKNEYISTLPKSDFEIKINFGEWLNKHTNKKYMFPEQNNK
jgi:hypothetical protein